MRADLSLYRKMISALRLCLRLARMCLLWGDQLELVLKLKMEVGARMARGVAR